MAQDAPIGIAHGFSNSRELVRLALENDVDFIEADVRLRDGAFRLEHDQRVPFLPVLFGRRPQHGARPQELSLSLTKWRLHVDRHPLHLEELLARVAGRQRLLLDLKHPRSPAEIPRFIENLLGQLRRFRCEADTWLCGDWPLLDEARCQGSGSPHYYSVANASHWKALVHRLEGGGRLDGVSLSSKLFDGHNAAFLKEKDVRVFCWPVDDRAEAERVLDLGADGIISYDLALLVAMSELIRDGQSERQRS